MVGWVATSLYFIDCMLETYNPMSGVSKFEVCCNKLVINLVVYSVIGLDTEIT